MEPLTISADDRRLFKQCRRQWDLAARGRRGLRRRKEAGAGPAGALRRALDVYYYPGMWGWDRGIVLPLVHKALDGAGGSGAGGYPASAAAHLLVDAFAEWAPDHDRFTPVQVAVDIAVNVPDPVIGDRALTTLDGRAVRYITRLDALVLDDDNRPWLLHHRVAAYTDREVLALDESPLTDRWAWEAFSLDPRMAGVMVTEIPWPPPPDPGERFRRHVFGYSREEIVGAGRQLGTEALEMLDAGLTLYPSPSLANCSACEFRPPCLVMRRGQDPTELLAAGYERLPAAGPVDGRLGGRTWSMNRGALPPRFDP